MSVVAGPVWQDENGDWCAEVQATGGHEQVAVAYGRTEAGAVANQQAIVAALSKEPE